VLKKEKAKRKTFEKLPWTKYVTSEEGKASGDNVKTAVWLHLD